MCMRQELSYFNCVPNLIGAVHQTAGDAGLLHACSDSTTPQVGGSLFVLCGCVVPAILAVPARPVSEIMGPVVCRACMVLIA